MKPFFSAIGTVVGAAILGAVAALASGAGAADESAKLEFLRPGGQRTLSLAELKRKIPVQTIEVDDPVYGAKKVYDAFPLLAVLEAAGIGAGRAKEGGAADEIVFTARDGYAPNAPFSALREHAPFLAFREHGRPDGEFAKVTQGKSRLSPGPFYVVWKEAGAREESLPWPYQLVRIEVVDFAAKFPKLYPKGAAPDSGAMRGFRIFKRECLRCHSINLVGGELGPELNAPKNVTEYWDRVHLRAFIANAPSFRFRSKMPPFPGLNDADLDAVLEYLAKMKDAKAAP